MPSVCDEEHEYFYIFETQIDNLKTSMNICFTKYFSDKKYGGAGKSSKAADVTFLERVEGTR